MPRLAIEESRYIVLRKLSELGRPINMLELGPNASPEIIRNMAARGMIRVEVTITHRGSELMNQELIVRKRKKIKAVKTVNLARGGL